MGSAVSSPSGVRGEVLATDAFLVYFAGVAGGYKCSISVEQNLKTKTNVFISGFSVMIFIILFPWSF